MLCFKQETSAEEGSIVVAIFRLYLYPFFEEELYIKIEEVTLILNVKFREFSLVIFISL